MTTKLPLQRILIEILHREDESTEGWEVLNLMRRTDKHSQSSIELAAHTEILKQQKQLNGRNYHIILSTNPEC
jgi:hypothetical protein